MIVRDIVIAFLLIALVASYLIIRSGMGRKIGKAVEHEKEAIKKQLSDEKENGEHE